MADHAPDPNSKLEALLARGLVDVHFQPIVDLNDGLIIAYEALTRLAPDSGFEGPQALFEAAGAAGKLWELEEITRTAALRAAEDWPRDVRLFLNCTPAVVADQRFARVLSEQLRAVPGLSPDRIVLEVTELGDDSDMAALSAQVKLAKDLGFHVALDDTGAGTSGLNRMMEMRPQWIKLDREFVRGINNDSFRQNLVRFFAHFARISGVSVIAEGIELPEELAVVMGLGVRFAQGYFLGRPADKLSVTCPSFVSDVRERWAMVESTVPQDFHDMPLARLCAPAATVLAGTPMGEVMKQMLAASATGVVVMEGRRLVGWCPSEAVVDSVNHGQAHMPVGARTHRGVCALPPEASVHDGLHLVCLREDDSFGDPIVVADGTSVLGVVRVRDLLRIATQERQGVSSTRAPVTGLPARVRADRHLEQLIADSADPARRHASTTHTDAAFIDIRRFADFNRLFGYIQGDRLIRDLSDMIQTSVVTPIGDAFLAHLGDDRFLLTSPAGRLTPALRELMHAFDARYAGDDGTPMPMIPPAGRQGAASDIRVPVPAMTLRMLVLPDIFGRVGTVRDIYRIEQQLRQRSRRDEAATPSNSVLIVDKRFDAPVAARLSA